MANLPGTYQVRAIIITAYNQRIESNAATVVVKAGTEITQHPKSMSTYVNKTNYLQILAAGDELSYRWEYRPSGRETKEWQSDSNDNTTGNTLKVSANQIQVRQYQVMITSRNGCPNIISNIATVTTVNNFKLNIRGKNMALAGHLAYFETDAPDNCAIAWDIYESNGSGHQQEKDTKFLPNENRTLGKKSIALLMPATEGRYMVKATVIDKVNNKNKCAAIGVSVVYNGRQGVAYPYDNIRLTGLAFIRLQQAMNSKAGDRNYDVTMDGNGDGKVDASDEKLFIAKFKNATAEY